MPDALLNEIAVTPLDEFTGTGEWRREITGNGRYWQWRTGSGKRRVSRYGGRTADLFDQSPELRSTYERNKEKEQQRRQRRQTRQAINPDRAAE